MAIFELTARHAMYLGQGSQIEKGERLTMNIHTLGVRPFSIFSTPESRRQAIQQFAVNGIDISSRDYLLNTGHWDIREIPNTTFHKSTEQLNSFSDFRPPWLERPQVNEVIDDVEMKKDCINLVKDFYAKGLDMHFAEKGLEARCEIATQFYQDVKERMGIDADIAFVPKAPNDCGGYIHATNSIELNSSYLENPDCEGLLNTILHESRHAFQGKCITNPESISVKQNIIDVWKDNFDNYISPSLDFEAYENQEIEKDANYFADSVMRKGMDLNYVI